jgi:hypothetical protein
MSGYSYRGMSPIENMKKMNAIINETISLFKKQFNDINKAITSIQANFNMKMQNIKTLLNQQEVITSQLIDNNNNVNCSNCTSVKQSNNSSSNHKHNNSQILTTSSNNNKNKSNNKKQISVFSSSSSDNITTSYYEMSSLSARKIHTHANVSIPKHKQCNILHKPNKQQYLTEHDKTLSRNKNKTSFTYKTQSQSKSNNPPKILSFDIPPLTITTTSPVSSLPKTNALLIAIHSPIMSIYDKLNIKYLCKRTYTSTTIKDICKECKQAITNRKRQLCNDMHYNAIYNKKYPSLTAQTCLQFLSNDKQNEIINSETNKTFTELIYIVLNDGVHFNKGKYNKELYKFLFEKYKVQSIRALFMKVVYEKVYVKRKCSKEVCARYLKLMKAMKGEIEKGIKDNKSGFGCVLLNLNEIGEYFNICELTNSEGNKGMCNKENEMLKVMENVIEEINLKQKS